MNFLDVEAELARPSPMATDDVQQYFATPPPVPAAAPMETLVINAAPEKARVPLASLISNMLHQLKDVESELGLSPNASGARADQGRLHAYGTLSVEQRRKEFKAHVSKVRSILVTYQTWIGNEREVDVSRYLQLVHDENSRKAQLEGTKKRLSNCQQLINRHLKTVRTAQADDATEATAPAQSISSLAPSALVVGPKLLLRLNKMARKFSMQCDVFETEKKWTTWTDDFVVDVSHFDSASRVQVELTRAEGAEIAISEQLTTALRNGTKTFQAALKHLVRLFELVRTHPADNLLQLERQHIPASLSQSLASMPQYRVESTLEGCRISFYVPPANPKATHCVALLTIDESLPGSPKADQLSDDLCYQLRLIPAVPFAATAFTLLTNILVDRPPEVPAAAVQSGAQFVRLTELIASREEREKEIQVRGDIQHYVDSSVSRGLLVERIPLYRLPQVPFVLQVLRQQAIFNALVASCYPSSTSLLHTANSSSVASYASVELHMDPPRKLRAGTFLPSTDGPKISLEVSVALGGELSCQLILASGTAPAAAARFHSNEYLTRVLQLSHSIPMTLHYALRK